jgi:hypothetical protein
LTRTRSAESLYLDVVDLDRVDYVEEVAQCHVGKETIITKTEPTTRDDGLTRIGDSVEDAEQSALEAVRRFLDTVDGVFPKVSEDRPRRKIIDSAFKMTEQLVGASNQLARRVVKVTEDALGEYESKKPSPDTKERGAHATP